MEAPSALRGLLLLLLFGSLFGQLALLVQEIVAPNDYCLTSREAAEYVDVSFVWAHVGAALAAAVLAFGALSLALRAAPTLHRTERCVASAAFSAAAAVVNTAGLLAPAGDAQQRTIGWLMLVQSACAALAVGVALGARAGAPGPACLDHAHTRHAFRDFFDDAETGMPSLAKLERFLEVRSVRGSIRASFRRSNGALAAAGGALGLLALCAPSLELARTAGVRPPLLTDHRIAELNDAKVTASYFGDAPTQPAGSARVVLLVVSGMRADALAVPALSRLLSTPHIARDALTLTLRAGPPSTSTSQWLSLLAGASARTTGVWGGVRVPESRFDSVFRQARLYSLSSFVSGSPWLTELFHSQLLRGERFYAEGAIPQPYAALPAADAADGRTGGAETDRQRMLLLRRAMAASHAPAAGSAAPSSAAPGRRRLFELLVAQLSEAETQAQCAGATAAFNARGSYAAAIANVSASVEQLIREMDARTTLIITSDHGHIDRGGAGGAEAHATTVPLIAYAPGSNLGLRAASAQRFSAAPRFDASPLRTSDLAPTLSALLGIPAPRQSEGVPIDDLMPLANRHALGLTYRDVYVQQQRLVASLAAALGIRLGGADAALIDAPPSTIDTVAVRDGVLALRDLRQRVLDRAAASAARSASLFTFLGALAVGGLLLWITQRGSFADVRLVISPLPGQYANRRAAVFAGVATACYFASASAVHLLLLRLRGYSAWDSTPLAFPTEASRDHAEITPRARRDHAEITRRARREHAVARPAHKPRPRAPTTPRRAGERVHARPAHTINALRVRAHPRIPLPVPRH